MSRCSACSAEIIWTVTKSGKRLPVDAEPTPMGNIKLVSLGQGKPPLADVRLHDASEAPDEAPMHLSHFVTCPKADEFRR